MKEKIQKKKTLRKKTSKLNPAANAIRFKIDKYKTEVLFLRHFPSHSDIGENVCLIYDENLLINDEFADWLKQFPVQIGFRAGEALKNLNRFSEHFQRIQKANAGQASRSTVFCVVGGGSLGDFGGFVASVYKRGARLVHVPSTWLAALDSAHGGKTGLNTDSGKNQVGTFFPAEKVFLVESLLSGQGPERIYDAYGELAKMAVISGGILHQRVINSKKIDVKMMYQNLELAIKAKYKVVCRDPYELNNIRDVLNLGHTMGHVFEFECGMGHGLAVAYGLDFAIRMSRYCFKKSTLENWADLLRLPSCLSIVEGLNWAKVVRRLREDKKITRRGRIKFVFPLRPGKVLVKEVELATIEGFYKQIQKSVGF